MEKAESTVLLRSLWDRIERTSQTKKWALNGPISSLELEALQEALSAFGLKVTIDGDVADLPAASAAAPRSPVKLVTRSASLGQAEDRDVVLCIDFGTAMSKAFASKGSNRQPLDLALGKRAGFTEAVYAIPSSLFISSKGRVYFGHEAIAESFVDSNPERERLDSPKQILSQGTFIDLQNSLVSSRINPTSVRLTQGDLLLAYLSFLTDLATSELESHGCSRYVRRRFAHPCWEKERMTWAENLLTGMLASAQILADTFSGRWSGGIAVEDLRSAIDGLSSVTSSAFLIEGGVPEPVAAAASVIVQPGQHRLAFVVVDVGAGTTDFGLFVATNLKDGENFIQAKHSIRSIRQAGDTIDLCLRRAILLRHQVDQESAYGRRIHVDLALRLRQYKERLFRDQKLTYELADDTTGTLTIDEFLAMESVNNFRWNLRTELSKILARIDKSWIEMLLARQGLRFVLTGGGARLPMVQELARGTLNSHGIELNCHLAQAVPDWIKREHPRFEAEYPQLAVAMGGAVPELPKIRNVFEKYGGGLSQTTVLAGKLQISGV